MEKKKDMLEQHLAENFIELAKEEEQQINHIKNHGSEDDIRMPEGTKEAIRAKLDDEIEKSKKPKEKRSTAVSPKRTAMLWSVDGKLFRKKKSGRKQVERKKCPQKNPQRSIQERGMAANLGKYILLWQQCS